MIWVVRIVGGAALAARGDGLWRRDADGHDRRVRRLAGGDRGVFPGAVRRRRRSASPQFLLRGEHEIPYGPFLCLAAFVVLDHRLARRSGIGPTGIFAIGRLLAALLAACMVLMGLMLWAYRVRRDRERRLSRGDGGLLDMAAASLACLNLSVPRSNPFSDAEAQSR